MRVVPPDRRRPARGNVARAWNAGKHGASRSRPTIPRSTTLLADADVVFDTPGVAGHASARSGARAATRCGCASRRSGSTDRARRGAPPTSASWPRAANMYCTGDPDRAPVRCTEPTAYAHTGAGGRVRGADRARGAARRSASTSRCRRSCSSRTWPTPARFPQTGVPRHAGGAPTSAAPARSGRRSTASCRSACAAARRASRASRLLTKLVAATARADARDGLDRRSTRTPRPTRSSRAIESAVAEYFARHTMQELYDIACETNLMLAPANSPREIYAVGAARGARLLRPGRRRRAVPAVVRDRPRPPTARSRRCGRPRRAPTVRSPDAPRGR